MLILLSGSHSKCHVDVEVIAKGNRVLLTVIHRRLPVVPPC